MEKLLPQNVEAEGVVLGSILISPTALPIVRAILRPEDFYVNAHRTIFAAALDLDTAGDEADVIALTDELARRGKLEEVGGASYVSSLANNVPTSRNAQQYARIVERTAVLRRLITAAGQIAAIAYNEPEASDALNEAQKLLNAVSTRRPLGRGLWMDETSDAFTDETLSAMERGEPPGVFTGDTRIDAHCGGFQPGELIYAAGRPGSGKSAVAASWAHHIAEHLAQRGGPGMVEWVTLEMRATQQFKRILSALTGVNGRVMRANFRGPDGQIAQAAYGQVRRTADDLKQRLARRIHFTDQPTTITDLRDLLTRQVNEHACVCAFVDYLSLLEPENAKQDTYQRVTDMSRKLKQIALELQIPIICLVQLNRETEKRLNKHPMLSDLRDSGGLEQDADWVLGIYRGGYYMPRFARQDAEAGGHFGQLMELIVLKAREGIANASIPVRFEGEYTRVSPWPQEWDWEQYARLHMTSDAAEGGAA